MRRMGGKASEARSPSAASAAVAASPLDAAGDLESGSRGGGRSDGASATERKEDDSDPGSDDFADAPIEELLNPRRIGALQRLRAGADPFDDDGGYGAFESPHARHGESVRAAGGAAPGGRASTVSNMGPRPASSVLRARATRRRPDAEGLVGLRIRLIHKMNRAPPPRPRRDVHHQRPRV